MLIIEFRLVRLNEEKLLGLYVIIRSEIRSKESFTGQPLDQQCYMIVNVGLLKSNMNIS